jgi:ribonuclease T2
MPRSSFYRSTFRARSTKPARMAPCRRPDGAASLTLGLPMMCGQLTRHTARSIARMVALSAAALGLALGAASLAGSASAQNRQRGEPGRFDFYLLSLSWSPSFCETANPGSNQQQCGKRPYSFVVHGLWPQFDRGFPENCQIPPPRLERGIVERMLDLMPAQGLLFPEWDTHGTCSGLGASAYFDTVRKAREAVKIPAEFASPQTALNVTPAQVVDAFVKANDGLDQTGMVIDCDRTRLREVRICLSRDLQFRDCEDLSRRSCRSAGVVMPPVRGQ